MGPARAGARMAAVPAQDIGGLRSTGQTRSQEPGSGVGTARRLLRRPIDQVRGPVLGGLGRLTSWELWPAQASTAYQRPWPSRRQPEVTTHLGGPQAEPRRR
jgi:hypothetical protein